MEITSFYFFRVDDHKDVFDVSSRNVSGAFGIELRKDLGDQGTNVSELLLTFFDFNYNNFLAFQY